MKPEVLRNPIEDGAARLTHKAEPETRAAMQRLVEAGLVEERGRGRGPT